MGDLLKFIEFLKFSFCAIDYASAVGDNSPMSNNLYISSIFVIRFNKQINNKKNPFNNLFLILPILIYGIPTELMKPNIWFYIRSFSPHLCCCRAIKIIPDRPIKTLTLFVENYLSHPPYLFKTIYNRLIIFLSPYIYPPPPGKML